MLSDPLWLAIFGPLPPRPCRPHPCHRLPRLRGVIRRRAPFVDYYISSEDCNVSRTPLAAVSDSRKLCFSPCGP